MPRSRVAVFLAVSLGVTIPTQLWAQRFSSPVPDTVFARPTGQFGVGTVDLLWVDTHRAERFTKDTTDKRKLPIQIWYPADIPAAAARAPYIHEPREFGPSEPFKPLEHVITNAVLGAPFAAGVAHAPVVIYHHGAGWPRFSATFLGEELASHGYVVIAVEHPGLGRTVRFADGATFTRDTLEQPRPAPGQDLRVTGLQTAAFLDSVDFPIWIDDSRFVLDKLSSLDRADSPLAGHLDLDRIGMVGWSFGGATSLEMLRVDGRVKAAINDDGQLFGGTTRLPIAKPFMFFHHGADDAAAAPAAIQSAVRDNVARIHALDVGALARATGDWYDLTIKGTNHGHFSDVSRYLSVFDDPALLDGRRAHQIIVAYTLAFFDRYLTGAERVLLTAPSRDFPEVVFRKRQ